MVNQYLAILIASIVSMIFGALWYGPLFGNMWMKLQKFTKKDIEKAKKKGMGKSYTAAFIANLVMAYIIALLVAGFTLNSALSLIFIIWVGFIITINLNTVLWEDKPIALYLLNNTYNLLDLIIMTSILVYLI